MPVKEKSVGLCLAKTQHPNKKHYYECRRRKDHVAKASKYAQQHMDSKSSPPMYWEPTSEEIEAYNGN